MKVRIDELQRELARAQARLREVEREEVYLREMLLRISGAIQVLEDLLVENEQPSASDSGGERASAEGDSGDGAGSITAPGDGEASSAA